ncbi:MAG: ABC transporter permease [Dehalococcoidia bacterium]
MSVALAYLRRDYLIWSSYRLSAFWQIAGVLVTVGLIYAAGTAIGDRSNIIEQEDGSYVAFILVGLAFLDILLQGLAAVGRAVTDSQRAGTLEPMLLTPISAAQLVVSFWLFRFLFSMFRMSVFILFGIIVLGFWSSANPLSVVAVMTPAVLTFLGMGALSAAFLILIKQGDPVLIVFATFTATLGGAFFPVDSLPNWIAPLAFLIPLTHALSGVREGLDGGSVLDVAPQVITLIVMAAVMVPVGFLAFTASLQRAKREGSLGEY